MGNVSVERVMTPHKYLDLKQAIIDKGYESDIQWAENLKICDNAQDFCFEYIFVVCNSGMKSQIARGIYEKICKAISENQDISEVFGHKQKVKGIKMMIQDHKELFQEYLKAEDKIEFCGSVYFMGDIIKYHWAKNLGVDCVKPDRHLVRIAKTFNTNPHDMCQKLSDQLGDSLNTVDTTIWRAANLGLV